MSMKAHFQLRGPSTRPTNRQVSIANAAEGNLAYAVSRSNCAVKVKLTGYL